ncbi:hypothetical protein Angca_000042, partial [Angiostrongylus cantonensis]
MVELAVGDLYDQVANTLNGVRIHPEAFYECKYCPMFQVRKAMSRLTSGFQGTTVAELAKLQKVGSMLRFIENGLFNCFQISGSSLRDSSKGRAHAAAHRIAFEALLEPSPVLVCPICDLPQKTSDTACIFGCMFNDLDLVDHLEQDHVDILADDVVCDFSDPRYLLTTFQEKQLPRTISERRQCYMFIFVILQERTHVGGESEDGISVVNANQVVADTISTAIRGQEKPYEELPLRRQMPGVSVISCLVCQWSPSVVSDSMRMREEIATHVRFHIREESEKLPNKSSSFFADQRMLSCMDFSLEEYFEKEHLSDLSGTINSQIMERVYRELLAKLFGICVPLVYRILHGNHGNPFRPPEASSKRRKSIRFARSNG